MTDARETALFRRILKEEGIDPFYASHLPQNQPHQNEGAPLQCQNQDWDTLTNEVSSCVLCKDLSGARQNTVFGSGSREASLMFVGEAPGADEDAQGLPFVGAAGQLLTKIIEAMGLTRDKVYIANVLKCRPPGNRPPQPEEIEKCRPFLETQIEWIRPKVICALGTHAAQTLLNTPEPISQLRGQFFNRAGVKVLATYHPAYLLRNPSEKRKVWEDMKLIMAELGI